MPQERGVPHAIAWRGHNPHQALPEHLVQSYPSLNAHTVGYGPFWENGIPEHLQSANGNSCAIKMRTTESLLEQRFGPGYARKAGQLGVGQVR